jgi:hypothetical protein
MDNVIARHTSQSIFDARGDLKREAAERAHGDVGFGEYLHIASIPWAPEPNGAEHCQWLSRLVEYMAELPSEWGGLGPCDKHDRKVLHAVAMLYSVGKGNLGVVGEPPLGEEGYAARSAAFAERFFREGGGAHTYWSKDNVREDVCRLIFSHADARAVREDRRLQVFADGLRYETVRLAQNTPEGLALLRERCRPEQFYSGWAKAKENFRSWMQTRGWR